MPNAINRLARINERWLVHSSGDYGFPASSWDACQLGLCCCLQVSLMVVIQMNTNLTQTDVESAEGHPPASAEQLDEQIGGGRRLPSPPPIQTPTRLRAKVKATERDTGLVRDAGMRRGRLLDDAPPVWAETLIESSIDATEQSRGQLACASVLFAGVASQSLFLTCKTTSRDSQETVARPAVADLPNKDTDMLWEDNIFSSSLPSAVSACPATPPSKCRATSPHPERPAVWIPPTPPLRDLREALAEVQLAKAPQASSSTENPQLADDAANKLTPRAPAPTVPFPCITDFDDTSLNMLDFDLPDRPETLTPPSPILDDAFQGIYTELSNIAGRVGLPFQQVLNRFTHQFSRSCAMNYWNTYQKFHAAHKNQEIERLGDMDLTAVTTVQTMKRCYDKFCEAYPDTWQKILTTFDELEAGNDSGKTFSHRQALFLRLAKHHCHAFAGMAKAHTFETVMIIAGGVVNQDTSLGIVYATPGTENFFQERCRANDNEILAHFKAHIYNKLSLTNVALAFDGPSGTVLTGSRPTTGTVPSGAAPSGAAPSGATLSGPAPSGGWQGAGDRGDRRNGGPCTHAQRVRASLDKDRISGVICHNFPDSVPFPGEDRQRGKAGSKGVADLSLADCSVLLAAFTDSSNDRLYFEHDPKLIADLCGRRLPVIIGAAPQPDSPHAFAKRMFADGSIDRTGPPRRPNLATTRIKKRKKSQLPAMAAQETITIVDSEDSAPRRKGKGKAPAKSAGDTLSLSESDGVREVPPPAVEKRCLSDRKGRPRPAAAAAVTVADDWENKVQDISSPSCSEFQPGEQKGGEDEGASNADEEMSSDDMLSDDDSVLTRKRIFVEVPHLASFGTKGKGKAPEQARKKRRSASLPASSEEECGGSPVPAAIDVESGAQSMTRDRPKPRIVMKKPHDLVGTHNVQDGDDPFSLRKRRVDPPSLSAHSKELHHTSANCATSAASVSLPEKTAEHATTSSQVTVPNHRNVSDQPSMPGPLLESSTQELPSSDPPPPCTPMTKGNAPQDCSSILSAGDTCAQPAMVLHETVRWPPAGGDVPGIPPMPLPGMSQEINITHEPQSAQDGAGVSHEHVPYPTGWFVPPGPGPRFQGYPGPFFNPYGGWGMYPNMNPANMNPAHHSAPTAPLPGGEGLPQAGRQGGVPFDRSGFYFGRQPFTFPNGYPVPNMPGTSDGGHAAQDGTSRGDTK
ncbi:hypothetical protein JVT61DRAFT_14685 [Boletus reticuloceps]|uniref:Uncharacterized protein n=1 Tax=Boletus reticuloceps TaxID=495285 RepID=A0A8I2YV15_9AGAM|nr:hypothetical protein JVT61DRAFT_14685 [Boletus reticuloceps]